MPVITTSKSEAIIIDMNMISLLSKHKWSLSHGYPVRSFYNSWIKKSQRLALHHVIAGHPLKGFCTDHINGNTLDNRRSNLRTVTPKENSHNTKLRRFLDYHGITPEQYLFRKIMSK